MHTHDHFGRTVWPGWFLSAIGLGLIGVSLAAAPRAFAQIDFEKILTAQDKNGDGRLEPSEVSGAYKTAIEKAAQRAGRDWTRPERISRIVEWMKAPATSSAARPGANGGNPAAPAGASLSAPPSFPAPPELPPPPSFSVPVGAMEMTRAQLEKTYDKKTLESIDDTMRRYDKNKDGYIDANEAKGMRWGDPSPWDFDKNKDGRLSTTELAARMASRGSSNDSSSNRGGSSENRSSSSSPAASGNDADRLGRMADGMISRYDLNKNGRIDGDELKKAGDTIARYDLNKDGVLTREEMIQAFSQNARGERGGSPGRDDQRGGPPGRDAPRGGPPGRDSGRETAPGRSEGPGGRSSYGPGGASGPVASPSADVPPPVASFAPGSWIRKPAEPLGTEGRTPQFITPEMARPTGLPEAFARLDLDGDGQVSMSEFTDTWTDDKAEEFLRLDINGDGLITVEEWQFAESVRDNSRAVPTPSSGLRTARP